jgi:hypothetical protein
MKKHSRLFLLLNAVGWGMVFISRYLHPTAQRWISGVGYFVVAAGLVVTLVSIITERRKLEAASHADTR